MVSKKSLVILLSLLVVGTGVLLAQTIYRYSCPKCNAVYSYTSPGIYKCPNDSWTLGPAR